MNRRRYDEVVSLLASVVLGTAIADFGEVARHIATGRVIQGWLSSNWLPWMTALAVFAIFFRNVHGLIAYDIWAENSKYTPPFEQKPTQFIGHFVFAFLAAVLFPYLSIFILKKKELSEYVNFSLFEIPVWMFLFFPLLIYLPWNGYWLWKLHKHFPSRKARMLQAGKTPNFIEPQRFLAYRRLRQFTWRWIFLDALTLGVFGVCLVGMAKGSLGHVHVLKVFVGGTLCVLILDYLVNQKFYFPKMRAREPLADPMGTVQNGSYFDFDNAWDYVLPDGLEFCHWGGREACARLIEIADLSKADRVLEICSGRGGLLALLAKRTPNRVVGVDISPAASAACEAYLSKHQRVEIVCEDVRNMAFQAETFSKILSQDGDVWLMPDRSKVISDLFALLAPNGVLIWQSYVGSFARERSWKWLIRKRREHDRRVARRTDALLRYCGYPHTSVPEKVKVKRMFEAAGFRVEDVLDWHDRYRKDNRQMRQKFEQNREKIHAHFGADAVDKLGKLLSWERYLFAWRYWSGVVVVARKPGPAVLDITCGVSST